MWNKLSTDCVTASSVNMFKNKLTHISGGQAEMNIVGISQCDCKHHGHIGSWMANLVKSC